MGDTKQKIVKTSILLFNKDGYSNVSLHQISKALGLSSGNLTYHFPKKESLMEAVYNHFVSELNMLQKSIGTVGSISQMIYEASEFAKFQQRFIFFYMNLLDIERSYPKIAKKHFNHIEVQIKRIDEYLQFNLSQGVLKQSLKSELITLAETIWMTVVFWPSQNSIRGKEIVANRMVTAIKSILKPYINSKYYSQLNESVENYTYN